MKRCLLCLLFLPFSIIAQTVPVGWIDNSFGNNGSDTINNATTTLISVFKGDSIIAGGNNSLDELLISKFDNNGHLCTSFGVNGSVHFHIAGYSDDYPQAIVVQPDQKILVGRNGYDTTLGDFLIVRLMPNGALDTTFNKTGILAADFDRLDNNLFSLALQPDGKILACGTTSTDTGLKVELVRFNSSGKIDSTFGSAGRAGMILGANSGPAYMTRLPDGKIIVGASWGGANNAVSAIMRFDSTGLLDSTFGVNGQRINSTPYTWIFSLQLLSSGKFLVSGETNISIYNSDGSLDSTFGTNGLADLNLRYNINNSCSAAVAPDGKILYTLTEDSNGIAVEQLARFNSNGTLDTSFGADGMIRNIIPEVNGSYIAYMHSVQVQSTGKVVASGYMETSAADGFGFLTRYYQASTSVPEIVGASGQFNIYPNPAQHDIIVTSTTTQDKVMLHIIDMNGRLVQSQELKFDNGEAKVNTNLSPGIYAMQLVDEKNGYIKTLKLLIER